MSSAISTYQLLDPILAISSDVKYGVSVGAQSINQQTFQAQTKSATAVTINCLIPSLSSIISRNVLIKTRFNIVLTGTSAAGTTLVNYPENCVLSAFPFSQMVNTLSVQLNNTTLNSNYLQVLNLALRQMSPEDLAKYADFSPTQLDYFKDPSFNSTLSSHNSISNTPDYIKSRGSFRIINQVGDNVNVGVKTVILTCETTEPIFCSPFLYGDSVGDDNCGMSGISSINFNFNLGNVGRAITWFAANNNDTITSCTIGGAGYNAFESVEVLMSFYSPKPNTLVPLTCALPYYELTNYTTVRDASADTNDRIITSNIVSPNCIPDKVYIFCRPQPQSPEATLLLNEFYYTITKLSVTWNTQSGLLASASTQELYLMSKKAGLKMDWTQFSGLAQDRSNRNVNSLQQEPTTGSIVCLNFNENIPIMESYYSSGSLGMWTFSVQATVTNNTFVNWLACELNVVFFQSGVIQSTSGSSSQYVGVLGKSEVLSVAQQPYVLKNKHARIVGSGNDSFLGSALKTSVGGRKMGASLSAGSDADLTAGASSGGKIRPRVR